MRTLTTVMIVAALFTGSACAQPEEAALMPQRQEGLDRYEQCREDSIGNAEHERDCRDAVQL